MTMPEDNFSAATLRRHNLSYFALCLLIPLGSSLIYPVLSLYLSTELQFSPFVVSLFFMLLPLATILIVQAVAWLSDKGLSRPLLILLSSLCAAAVGLLLALRPSELWVCTIGLLLFGASGISFPQIFASAREYAVRYLHGSMMFSTVLRALVSLAWVMGPPLSYYIATELGFNALYAACGCAFVLSGLYALLFLPRMPVAPRTEQRSQGRWWRNRDIMLLFISCALTSTAFSSYITSMPLYLTAELDLGKKLPGVMYALGAFFEIPIMLISVRLSRFVSLKNLLIVAAACQTAFLLLIPHYTSAALFMGSALLPAMYIALFSNLGMLYFQKLMPAIPGQATSLFINSGQIGQVLAGLFFSLSASGSYKGIYYAGALCCVLGLIMLFKVGNAKA